MVGVASSTLPTRRVGEVLPLRWRKSKPGKGLVCREYFAKPPAVWRSTRFPAAACARAALVPATTAPRLRTCHKALNQAAAAVLAKTQGIDIDTFSLRSVTRHCADESGESRAPPRSFSLHDDRHRTAF